MPKKIEPKVEETEDGGVALALKPSKRFSGSDDAPIDIETGDSVFDDLSPRFVRSIEEATTKPKKKVVEADADEDEEVEVVDEDEQAEEQADEAEEAEVDETDEEESESDDTDEVDPKPAAGKKSAFEKRLDRSERLVEESRREAAELRSRLSQQEQRVKVAADDNKYQSEKTKLEADLVKVRAELRTAIEAGETEDQVAAQEKLSEVKGDLKVLEARHVDSKLQLEEQKNQRQNGTIVKTKSEQWIRRHPRFTSDSEFANTAKVVDSQVARDGFNPETDEYYKEVDKRMSKFYPKEFGGGKIVPKVRKHPASGMRQNEGGGGKPAAKKNGAFEMRGGKVYLTQRQVQTMRTFQLDPTNPNDVRDFVEQNR